MSLTEVVKATDKIRYNLRTTKITDAQIDPFGYCNAKCWFCPVRYQGNPMHAAKHMSPDLMDKVLSELHKEKFYGVVSPKFDHFYTAHYNEILLYKYLDEMLYLCKCYGFKTMILSNGINLTEEKVELLKKHKDVISGINLNIPAFEDGLWQERSGIKRYLIEDLHSAVRRTMEAFPEYTANGAFSIGVNCPNFLSQHDKGGWMELLENAPDIDLDPHTGELAKQVELGRKLFPGLNVYPVESLVDRAAILEQHKIISNRKTMEKVWQSQGKTVVGCSNGQQGRLYGYLHINALGEAFLCCNDYDIEYTFGNLKDKTLREIWLSENHIDMLNRALKTICTACASAVWK